jgi:hypothetical protein
MSRGIVLFGVNNDRIDYVRLAVMAHAFIKKNMPETQVCLITDEGSKRYYESQGYKKLTEVFDVVKLLPNEEQLFQNNRSYRDTRYYSVNASFKNEARASAYDLSPFDETLLIDSDYLICSDTLKHVWGSKNDVMINNVATNLYHQQLTGQEFRLSPFGIRMYWATVIYFKKGNTAKTLFGMVDHIKENWDFYRMTYEIPGHLFRNDYAFSIAIHVMNGFVESDETVKPLPEKTILTALDTDQFYKIKSPTELLFFSNSPKENWKFNATRLNGINVHCMNKLSLLNNMDLIMETLADE